MMASQYRQNSSYFNPRQLPNLLLWLDGTDPNGNGILPANNGAVGTWTDKSGRGNNATQATGANQPAFKTVGVNGRPSVLFDGVNDQLQFSRIIQDDWTIIVVFAATVAPSICNLQWYCGCGLIDAEVVGIMNDFGLSLNSTLNVIGGTGNPETSAFANGNFLDGLPHVVTYTRLKSSGALNVVVDNSASGSAVGGTQTLNAPSRIVIGSLQPNAFYVGGYFSEVIICSSVLSAAYLATINNYTKNKWGTP